MKTLKNSRNFCIIAHIDHGKTTLSDRLLEMTATIERRQMRAQLLDAMDLERERGITIKSHPVSMVYAARDGERYQLNLIDTPGHVDFSYEVSRSLAACEGALLLVDATQGIEAQTVANAHLAMAQGLVLIPVINKVDLPSADPFLIQKQIEDVLAIPSEETLLVSAKSGSGVEAVLEAIVQRVPQPRWGEEPAVRALVFDSVFDDYKGVICYVRLFSGSLQAGDAVRLMCHGIETVVKEVGRFTPNRERQQTLAAGQVGYVVTNIREVAHVKLGDTLTLAKPPTPQALPGYKEVRPLVFSGLYPLDSSDYEKLKSSLGKLQLNDPAFVFQSGRSVALGFGFRCGFLGLLHMEIVQERMRREYGLDVILTYPSVIYRVCLIKGSEVEVDNPGKMLDASQIDTIQEPMIKVTLYTPTECVGDLLALVTEKRGTCERTENVDESRLILICRLPLNEILVDFNDRLKSVTRGYGSMDYEMSGYEEADLVKLDILVNGEPVDALSSIVHRSKAESQGRAICKKLKEILPRQLFKVALQAAVGAKIIARETLGALRKDVTAKCYGGDITRKRKLLEKQKEGKKRMKQIGRVAVPQEAFVAILKQMH